MLASVLAIVIGIGAYSLNDGPRHRVPEEGKGPGGAENKLRLRGLFSQERRSLGPRAEEAWLEQAGAASTALLDAGPQARRRGRTLGS